jgi:ABC-2 type transport system ATP-binding protein
MQQLGTGAPAVLPSSGLTHAVVADLVGPAGTAIDTVQLVEQLVRAGVPVSELVVERPDLEDLFVELTGEGFDVDE